MGNSPVRPIFAYAYKPIELPPAAARRSVDDMRILCREERHRARQIRMSAITVVFDIKFGTRIVLVHFERDWPTIQRI